jgi:4-cresol dehydrogenase (hydroxylating)
MESTPSSATEAVEAWRRDIGADAVVAGGEALAGFTHSTCGSAREVIALLRPASLDEVQKIVATANAFRVPLYPVSCGKQWGMGSRLPVRDGAAIVELSRMNRIIEVSARYRYAVVEPGVTQRQLLDYIREKDLPLMLNVTGSTSDTSLIGNAMDRGVGYFASRAEGISNLQVVLGSGETIQTGFGHYANARTKNLYHHGIGPSLNGLFPQANFGIVTSACIDLMPRPEAHMAAIIKIDAEEKLPLLIDALAGLRSRGIFLSVAHIANRERSCMTLAPLLYEQLLEDGSSPGPETQEKALAMLQAAGFGPWSAAIGIVGTRAQLKLAKKEIRRSVGSFARTQFLNDALVRRAGAVGAALSFIPAVRRQWMMLRAVEPVYGFTRGDATDEALKAVYWAAGDLERLAEPDPDRSNSGVLYCLPIIPADGAVVADVVDDTRETFSRHGFEAAITVNLMDTRAMEGVVSLAFRRDDPDRVAGAHACIREMENRYMQLGFPPYRVGINSMDRVVHEDDPFWQTVREIKKALDPNGIIAPGRYNLV